MSKPVPEGLGQADGAHSAASTSMTYHPTIKVEYRTVVKFEADFRVTSDICLVGPNGSLTDQLDTASLDALAEHAKHATHLEMFLNFRHTRDESASFKQSISSFIKRLAEIVKTFDNVKYPLIEVKLQAENIDQAYNQLQNIASFYYLKVDWELYICFARKKGEENFYAPQYVGNELDRRIQATIKELTRTESKKKAMGAASWR